MSCRKDLTGKQESQTAPVVPPEIRTPKDNAQYADLRRLIYERIALGNALADAEAEARLKWIVNGNGYLNYPWDSSMCQDRCRVV